MPLRCEDLYGALPAALYSYRAEASESLFLKRQRYAQDAPPERLSPPQISYTLLTPRFDFVYRLVQQTLLEQPAWRSQVSYVPLDNALFGTRRAYQEQHEQQALPRYLLFFDRQIVLLELDELLNEAQIPVIIAKLGL